MLFGGCGDQGCDQQSLTQVQTASFLLLYKQNQRSGTEAQHYQRQTRKTKGEHDEKEKLCLSSQFCKPGTSPWRPRSQWTSAACQRCHRTPPLCVACGGKIKTAAVRHWLSIGWWHLVNWTTIFISLPLKPGFERTIWEAYLLTHGDNVTHCMAK